MKGKKNFCDEFIAGAFYLLFLSCSGDGEEQALTDEVKEGLEMEPCSKQYKDLKGSKNHICTRFNYELEGNATAEYTGGMLFYSTSSRKYLVGIYNAEFEKQKKAAFPTVYTRVSSLLDWIAEKTDNAIFCSRHH